MGAKAYVAHDAKLVVLWAPKCACSAVVNWFWCTQLNQKSFKSVEQNRDLLALEGYLISYSEAASLVKNNWYKSIQFTRNPYSRAVSAYLDKFYIHHGRPLKNRDHLEALASRFVREYNRYRGIPLGGYRGFSFVQFLVAVNTLISTKENINDHWDLQVPNKEKYLINPDYIVWQEYFDQDLSLVNSRLGLENFLPPKLNSNSSPFGFVSLSEDLANVNNLKLLRDKIFLTKKNFLNNRAVGLISKIYSRDFDFFGYKK